MPSTRPGCAAGAARHPCVGARRCNPRLLWLAGLIGLVVLPTHRATAHPTGTVFSSPVDGDAAAILWNPAAMILSPRSRVDIIGNLSIPQATYQRSGVDAQQTGRPYPSVSLTSVRPEPVVGVIIDRLWRSRMRLGFTVTVPYAGGAVWPAKLDDRGQEILGPTRYHITNGQVFHVFAQLGASIAVHPKFAIGASVNVVLSHLRAEKDIDLANQGAIRGTLPCDRNPIGCENPTASTPLKLSGTGASAGASIGFLWRPHPMVRIGAGYISPTKVPIAATLSIDPSKLEGFARQFLPGFNTLAVNGSGSATITVPQRVHVAIAVDVHPRIELMAQLRWINFSQAEIIDGALTTRTSSLVPDALQIPGVKNDEWGGILRIIGRIKERTRLAFSLAYTTASVPDAFLTPNNLDFDTITLNLAANFRVSQRLFVGASFSQGVLLPRTITRSAFSNASAEPFNLADPSGRYTANSERLGLDLSAVF